MRVKEKFSKKLLVEGNDDQHVIWSLCTQHQISETFDVIDCDGIDNLKAQLPIRFKTSGIDTIGIIIDADTDLNTRWESIKSLLHSEGFIFPESFPTDGLILTNQLGNRKFGAWIMPNNNLNGMLEDFISFLIPQEDQLLPHAASILNTIEDEGLRKYSPVHHSKATIHTWLAWQESPGTPMGLSITKKYLNTQEETCQRLIEWLKKLYRVDK